MIKELLGVIGLTFLAVGSGCQPAQNGADQEMWRTLINELDRLGFWSDVPEEERASGIEEMIRGQNIHLLETSRFIIADDESLAEFGITDFLVEHRDRIALYGGTFNAAQDVETVGYGYRVAIDGQEYEVYTAEHLEAEERGEWSIWKRAAKTTQQILNDMLERHGSENRAFWFSGGNDSQVCLMTPEMARVMLDSGLLGENERPRIID
jgi:hypothetical protein